jgi:hypothetical protein
MADGFGIKYVTNTTEYDFPFIDLEAENKAYREAKDPTYVGPKPRYVRPDVPVLMMDGKTVELKSGETKAFPKEVAEYFATRIVRQKLVEAGDPDSLRIAINPSSNPKKFDALVAEVISGDPVVKKAESVEEKPLGEQSMAELRKQVTEAGLTWKPTDKKEKLVDLINGAK